MHQSNRASKLKAGSCDLDSSDDPSSESFFSSASWVASVAYGSVEVGCPWVRNTPRYGESTVGGHAYVRTLSLQLLNI